MQKVLGGYFFLTHTVYHMYHVWDS